MSKLQMAKQKVNLNKDGKLFLVLNTYLAKHGFYYSIHSRKNIYIVHSVPGPHNSCYPQLQFEKILGCENHARGSKNRVLPAAADFMRISTTYIITQIK